MQDWNARQYVKFEDERTRPPRDLLAQVPLEWPRRVVDLGCGPGNSTELLRERFPHAEVIGLDSSPNMLALARQRLPQCRFIEADIVDWTPDAATDVVFANAVFQWVPDHAAVLRRLAEALPPGGALAVQMPDNTREPSHQSQREVAESWPWPAGVTPPPSGRGDLPPPDFYYDLLKPVCSHVDVWQIVYNHPMPGARAIVEWFKGSSLRPLLAALDPAGREKFLAAYEAKIAQAYAPRFDGQLLLRFPRFFLVAVK